MRYLRNFNKIFRNCKKNLPYCTVTYHTIPHHTVPYCNIQFHIVPHTIPYHTMPYRYHSNDIIPYHTIPHHIKPYHTIPYRIVYHIISCRMLYVNYIITYHIKSCHMMIYHIISYHIWSCHIIYNHIICIQNICIYEAVTELTFSIGQILVSIAKWVVFVQYERIFQRYRVLAITVGTILLDNFPQARFCFCKITTVQRNV